MMIYINRDNNEKFQGEIDFRLTSYNREKCKWLKENDPINNRKDNIPCNFIVFDDKKLIGGAIGHINYGWYFLDLLWIDKQYRGRNIGTSLIYEMESYSKLNDLIGIRMETWDFQAKDFYQKMGYEIYAELKDCPPGTIEYHFKKLIYKEGKT